MLLIASCGKKDGGTDQAKTDNLASGVWTLTRLEFQVQDGSWVNDPSADSRPVITYDFRADGTLYLGGASGGSTARWHYASGNAQIVVTSGTTESTYTVSTLTGAALVYAKPFDYPPYSSARYTFAHL
jgi:hypothetical protein